MGSGVFTAGDFRVFEIPDFAGRMRAIAEQVRPKLVAMGQELTPEISRLVGAEVFAHVAKHARRTVNPPEDTWVAFGPDRRGYKKYGHFKVAISRNCMRVLFEVGPEHHDKRRWGGRWSRRAADLAGILKQGPSLGWYKDEHDEDPAVPATGVDAEQVRTMLRGLMGRKDGQLVFGRRLARADATEMTAQAVHQAVLATFRALVPLYRAP